MGGILISGLPGNEAAAIEMLIGMHWRDSKCVTLKRSLLPGRPRQSSQAKACSHCVVDLSGLGLRRYSRGNAQRLLEYLGGRSAVGLVAGDGGGWLEAELSLQPHQQLAWVSKPYTRAELQEAIKRIKSATEPQPGASKAAAEKQANHSEPELSSNHSASRSRSAAPLSDSVLGLSKWASDMLLKALPELRHLTLMPAESARRSVSEDSDAIQRSDDIILWESASETLQGVRLKAEDDLTFQLRFFPNFTRLKRVEPLDLQMAAICACAPQSLYRLLRAFPDQESAVTRFVALCIVSGSAVVLPEQSAAVSTLAPRANTHVKRSFLKLLLDKLS